MTIIFCFPHCFLGFHRHKLLIIPLQNECFWGYTGITLSVCPSVCLSVYPSVYNILVSVKVLVGVLGHI